MKIQEGTIVDEWVVVRYDGQVYPGIVVALHGADIEVKAMECAGNNRYKWPKHQDQIHYEPQNVLCLIPEPKHVTRRHVEISPEIWQLLQNTT